MHSSDRAATAALLVAVLLPLSSVLAVALSDSGQRAEVESSFRVAISDATAQYQRLRGLPALQTRYAEDVRAAAARTAAIMHEKRVVRLQIAALRREIVSRTLGAVEAMNAPPTAEDRSAAVLAILPHLYATSPLSFVPDAVRPVTDRFLVATLDEALVQDPSWLQLRRGAVAVVDLPSFAERLDALEDRHAALLVETEEVLKAESEARDGLRRAEEQLRRIQQNMLEVHQQVIRLQSALARIDARIRARVERDLIEKGLLTPGSIDHSALALKDQFAWPAYGRISAGFMDAAYRERFGVPHRGMDIALAQASPVHSAADGVVFLARDGGATGYSYVLVGHRGGYATLYGHLSQITVTAGQDVYQGQPIGLSGGEVGAHGSGPSTTGPHLHFEVIANGTYVDPKTVLP